MKKSCVSPRNSIPSPAGNLVGRLAIAVLLVAMLGWPSTARGGDGKARPEGSLVTSLDLIRSVLTRADSDRCPMMPSCSTYARRAFRRHGALMGWIMTCDRLLRCGRDEKHLAPKVFINGRILIYDPLKSNDFWWRASH